MKPNIMGKTLHFAILIFTILFTPLAAQEGVWSLEQCMQYAIDNAPQIKQQQLYNANARQNYIASVANLLPSIGGSVGTNSSFGRSIDPESNSYTNTSTFNNTYSISGSMVVFNGFRLVNSLKISKIGRLLGKEQLQLAHDQIKTTSMSCFTWDMYRSHRKSSKRADRICSVHRSWRSWDCEAAPM